MLSCNDSVKAIINLKNLKSNVRTILRLLSPGSQLVAVVKADAYGHGAVQVSRACLEAGASTLAVADTVEGRVLRESGIEAPIIVLSRCTDTEAVCEYNLIPAVSSYAYAERLNETALNKGKQVDIHLKINTGMSRLGFDSDAVSEVKKISRLSNLRIAGAFSHFAVSDVDDGEEFTRRQYECFNCFIDNLLREGISIQMKHICNSGGTFSYPDMHLDAVRCGIALYGCHPDETGNDYGLLPVMELKSRVLHIRSLKKGETISYGRTFKAENDMLVAVVSCGYADGYHRLLSGKTDVLIKGKRAPVRGRICMDVMMADVTGIEGIAVGDEVTLIGRDCSEVISADELASLAETISYEILTSVSQRVKREYKS